jgi:hypothetical protein
MGRTFSTCGVYNSEYSLKFDHSGDLDLSGKVLNCCPLCMLCWEFTKWGYPGRKKRDMSIVL